MLTVKSEFLRFAPLIRGCLIFQGDDDKDYEVKKPYQFGYEIEDGHGNMQHRHEQSDGT